MRQDNAQNAMTEIALALAMAFFSIMVLAMVSMGSQGGGSQAGSQVNLSDNHASQDEFTDVPVKENQEQASDKATKTHKVEDNDHFIIFYQGQLFNRDLTPTSIETVKAMQANGKIHGRIILAMDPETAIEQAIDFMATLNHNPNHPVEITALNQAWINRLRSE